MAFTNILAAFDGSEVSQKALNHAMELARTFSSPLHVVHAFQFPVYVVGEAIITPPAVEENHYYNYAQSVIDHARSIAGDLPNAQFVLKQGLPSKTILEYADELGADLIVIGSRGLSGIREIMLGSVSHHVVQHAKVPVMVVK